MPTSTRSNNPPPTRTDPEDKVGYYLSSKNSRESLMNEILGRKANPPRSNISDSESKQDRYQEPYPSTKNTPSVEDKYSHENGTYMSSPHFERAISDKFVEKYTTDKYSNDKLHKRPSYGTYHHKQASSHSISHSHRPNSHLVLDSSMDGKNMDGKNSGEKNRALNRSLSGDRKNFDRKNMSGEFRESMHSQSPTNSFSKYIVVGGPDPSLLDVKLNFGHNVLE